MYLKNTQEQNKIFGTIYLPDKPNDKIVGVWLTITSNSILIETPHDTLRNENWPILLGEFNGIDQITFVNCYSGGGSSGAGGTFKRIYVSYLIEGTHISESNELKFNKIIMNSPALNNWITDKSGIKDLEDGKYQIPEKKEILNVDIDNVNISIYLSHSITSSYKELQVSQECRIMIKSDDLVILESFSKIMGHLKKLILFLTNKNPEFEKYSLYKDGEEYGLINTNDSLKEDRFTQNIHISYLEIKSSLKAIVSFWFKHEKLYPVIDLVLEKCYNTQMSPQGFFLNICVAVETFHRTYGLNNKKEIEISSPQNKQEIISLISNNEPLLSWFKEKSKEWEKPTLLERLNDFKETIGYIMGSSFAFDADELINRTKQTRNDMAHTGEYKKRFNRIELLLVAKVIEFTIKLEILKLIGVNIEKRPASLLENAKQNISILAKLNGYK